jgi:hypothetical protein
MLSWTPELARQQKRAIAAARERMERFTREEVEPVEGVLLVFALMNVAREILNKYPEQERAMIVDQTIMPFMQNERPLGDEGKLITLVQ